MFVQMMKNFGFESETEAIWNLFWVLDLDDSGSIDFAEMVMGV